MTSEQERLCETPKSGRPPLPSHLSKDSKEKKGGCPEVKEVPALCLGFLICQVGMVMNPAQRITGRIKWVNSWKALKAGDASMVSTQSILARMFVSIITIHADIWQRVWRSHQVLWVSRARPSYTLGHSRAGGERR